MGLVDVKKRESWCENLWPGQEETGAGVVKSGPQQPWDTVASLSPLEGLAAPSLPDENTGSGAAFHWSVALVTLLAILVSRSALWVGQMGLCQVPSSWQGGSWSSSRSFCSASSLASSRTGRCMSTSKFTVQGKRISMEMASPCGTPATAWCQVGWCPRRWEHLWSRSLHSARSF